MAEPLRGSGQSFFQRWEREFRRSLHPLAPALHGFVALEELRARSNAADYLYSRSTFELIDEAKGISTAKTLGARGEQGRSVVRLRDVAAALLLRVHGTDGTSHSRLSHAIEQSLASALSALPATAALKDAAARKPAESRSIAGKDAETWVLDPDLIDTCALAAYLAGRTGPDGVPAVDLDDFIIALLLIPAGRKLVFETLLESDGSSPATPVSGFIRPLISERLSRDPIWDEILREIDEAAWATASDTALETRVPDYVADRPIERLRDDVLNFGDDARAVAEIVCQREPGPPLAIGLFGDWGSGKSSFMNLLRHEIDQLTAQARAHEGGSPFITRADHVFFNAWQYNDAHLWPVLAESAFAQLRAGGAEGLSRQLSNEVLQELTKRVESWQDTADGLALDLMQAQHQETERRDELLQTANERDNRIRAAREEAIEAVGRHLARSSQSSTATANEKAAAAELIDAAEASPNATGAMLRDVVNAARIVWELGQQRWRWFVLLGIAVSALLIIGSLAWLDIRALLGLLAPLVPILVWFSREVRPLVAALGTYRVKQAQAERAFRAAQRETALELAHLDRDMRRKQNEIRRQLSRAAQFKGRSPAQVLEFFLSEGAAVQALQDEVGVVSRVRRAFEQLNAVVKGHERADDTPQRIVFYIDDLDRCRAEQVVRVLEAVHLLLAFDRFVVVVGVDTRWLETSLMSFYDEQLRANRDAFDRRNGASPDPRATVRDYVEKIFQVPIQIPRLTTGEEGTFARLVDVLAPVAAREQGRETGADETKVGRYRQVPSIRPLDLTMPEPERFGEAVARAQLEAAEVELLKQLGPLAGRSPRAVKRLLNLYRLLRATRTGAKLEAFLGSDGATGNRPDYPGVQLCLAAEVGLPTEQIHRFREAVLIAAGVAEARPSQVFARPARPSDPWAAAMEAFFEALSPAQQPNEVRALFDTVVGLFGDTPDRLQVLRSIVIETSRFSFSPLAEHPWRSGRTSSAEAALQAEHAAEPRKRRRVVQSKGD